MRQERKHFIAKQVAFVWVQQVLSVQVRMWWSVKAGSSLWIIEASIINSSQERRSSFYTGSKSALTFSESAVDSSQIVYRVWLQAVVSYENSK